MENNSGTKKMYRSSVCLDEEKKGTPNNKFKWTFIKCDRKWK